MCSKRLRWRTGWCPDRHLQKTLSQTIIPRCFKISIIVPVEKKPLVSCLNDYLPVTLKLTVMKCFDWLTRPHNTASLPALLDPYQFAYRPNRSAEDAISIILHSVITQLDHKDTYARVLYIDFGSAFNVIVPQRLMEKVLLLGLETARCLWILDFLTKRAQTVRVGKKHLQFHHTEHWIPQRLSAQPTAVHTANTWLVLRHERNQIFKLADKTTKVGLIQESKEAMNRDEVKHLEGWYRENNLLLNNDNMKGMIHYFRRSQAEHAPLCISGPTLERVEKIKFLGVKITQDMTWNKNTS